VRTGRGKEDVGADRGDGGGLVPAQQCHRYVSCRSAKSMFRFIRPYAKHKMRPLAQTIFF
jgi:predicted transcriptional regulator